jgi:transcriptional regulator with XRE-family HTH domain
MADDIQNEEAQSNEGFPEIDTFLSAVGDRIQKVREFRGMTRREFGEALGLKGNSAGTGVYAIETSGNATRLDTIYKSAKVLGVTPGFLLDGGELKIEKSSNF